MLRRDRASTTTASSSRFRGRYIGDGGALSGVSVDVADRPAPRRVDAAEHLRHRAVALRGRRPAHEQVPDRAPTAASAGPGHTAREALIDEIARGARHRPARAAAQEHASRREPAVHGGAAVRRWQLRGVDRRRPRWSTTRRCASARRAAQRGPLHRHRLQPLRRADRLGGGDRRRPTASRRRYFDRRAYDGARRLGGRHDRLSLARAGPRDEPRPAHRGRARRAARGRHVVQGDTARAAYGMGTYASRSAVIAGGAIIRAAAEVRKKLLQIAASELEASEDDLELADGIVRSRASPTEVDDVARGRGVRPTSAARAARRSRPQRSPRRAATTRRRPTATAASRASSRSTSRPAR